MVVPAFGGCWGSAGVGRFGPIVRLATAVACLAAIPALCGGGASAAAADRGAVRIGPAPAERPLTLLLGLRRDDAGLARTVAAVSDPRSPAYRDYLDVPEIARRFGAAPATRSAVLRALRRHGVRGRVAATGAWVEATVGAGRAQKLFATRLARFRKAGRDYVAPVAPVRLPAGLRGLVTEVVGLDDRAGVRPAVANTPSQTAEVNRFTSARGSSMRANSGTQAGCAAGRAAGVDFTRDLRIPGYTPNQYLRAYGYDRLHRRGRLGQGQRIAVIEIDGFRRSDVVAFGRCFGKRVPPTPITRVGIRRPLAPGGETTLDLEVLTAAAPGLAEIQVMETSGSNASLIGAYERVLARPRARRASVISASLGQCEPEFYGQVDQIRLFEQVFRAAAAAGVSNLASTGDTGSTGCALGDNASALALPAVSHPATLPHVTAVGGTNLVLRADNSIADEIVWRDAPLSFGAGTGGYSLFFPRPSWQRGPGVSGAERIVPDVSMLADLVPGYVIHCSACGSPAWQTVGGTSAATPLLAAGVAIANQQARLERQAQLGYLNPLIYHLARRGSRGPVFRDVRRSNNDLGSMLPRDAGGGPIGCCPAGRNHDPASGWGSVSLPAFSLAARRAAATR